MITVGIDQSFVKTGLVALIGDHMIHHEVISTTPKDGTIYQRAGFVDS